MERLESVPGVVSATSGSLPLGGRIARVWDFTLADRPQPRMGDRVSADYRRASLNYFETLGVPMLQGPSFSEDDYIRLDESAFAGLSEREEEKALQKIPISIVLNETLARGR